MLSTTITKQRERNKLRLRLALLMKSIKVRCCHRDVFLRVKWDLKTHFQRPYGCTSGFDVPIWAAPLLERAERPLEDVVWPESAKYNPSKSVSKNTDHVTSN